MARGEAFRWDAGGEPASHIHLTGWVDGRCRSEGAHSGVGLGLAVVRGIVERHGGTITATSDGRGQGACFTIRLPLGQEG